jgi:hypothetical protein
VAFAPQHVVLPTYPPSQPSHTPPTDGQRHDRLLDDLDSTTPHFRDVIQHQYRVEMSDVLSFNPSRPPSDNVDLLNRLTTAGRFAITRGWTCHVDPCVGPYWFHAGDNVFQIPIPYHPSSGTTGLTSCKQLTPSRQRENGSSTPWLKHHTKQ